MDIFSGIIFNIFPSAAAMFADWIAELLSFNNNITTDLFNNSAVIAFFSFVTVLGSILFIFGVGFAFGDWAIKARDGSCDNIIDTFKNAFVAFVALLSFSSVPVLLLRFTNDICLQLSKGLSTSSLVSIKEAILNNTYNAETDFWSGFALPIFVIIMFICVVKLFLANMKRGGILVILIFVCPMHLFSIPRGYTDAFFSWCNQVLAISLTSFIQNFLVTLSLIIFSASTNTALDLVISAGVALSASEAPRILQQFGLDTSMRANVTQAIYGVSGAVSLIKGFR